VKQPKVIELANSGDWSAILNVVGPDAESWIAGDDNANLRFMGTSFSQAKMPAMALAVFIVLQEIPKLQALLLVDEELRKMAVGFAEAEPGGKYAEVILRVVNGI
jgi:hypothetical protein